MTSKNKTKNILKAVTLKYPENAHAPFITFSAKGELAKKIIDIAEQNEITIIEDEILANVLSIEEIGSYIPEETWEAVAEIFAFIIEHEQEAKKNISQNNKEGQIYS